MFDFLFVWSRSSRKYPVRFWVRGRGQAWTDSPMPLAQFDGAISAAYAEDLLAGLRQRFKEPDYIVERMSATSWETVEENFEGLYLH